MCPRYFFNWQTLQFTALQTSNLKLYYIALVLPEPLQSEITAFKTDIHQRFGAKSALKSPVHITLFPPFRWDSTNENALKTAITDFSLAYFQKRRPLSVSFKNFDFFRKSTIFIQPESNENLNLMRTELLNYLSTHINLRDEKDAGRSYHPRVTIVNRDISETYFEIIWAEYSSKTFTAGFEINGISLLKKGDVKWEVTHATHVLKY
jgi:2'-5' RNA ligase